MEFRADINRFRGLAILLVVVSHTLSVAKGTDLGLAFYTAMRGATWPFLFIAGYLFAHLRDRYTWRTFLRGKFQNVLAPYVIIVSLAIVAGLTKVEPDTIPELEKYYILGYPAAAPLWFIPMIVLFYIGFPFYRSLCSFPRTLVAVTGGALLFAMAIGRPLFDAGPLPNFLFFQSAFLFGLAWRVHRERVDALVKQHYALIILVLVIGINVGMGPSAVFERGQVFALIPLTMLLVPALRADSPLNPIWEWLASRSFGIFFLHGFVTDQLEKRFGNDENAVLALLFGVALTFACGLFVSLVRQVAGFRSRFLVGA